MIRYPGREGLRRQPSRSRKFLIEDISLHKSPLIKVLWKMRDDGRKKLRVIMSPSKYHKNQKLSAKYHREPDRHTDGLHFYYTRWRSDTDWANVYAN